MWLFQAGDSVLKAPTAPLHSSKAASSSKMYILNYASRYVHLKTAMLAKIRGDALSSLCDFESVFANAD